MARDEFMLSDEQWQQIAAHLPNPPPRPKGGRPRADARAVFEGILWILWTGAPWRALPSKYPSPSTCWRRLRDWEEDGTWLRLWRTFIGDLDECEQLDWSESFIDATFVPAKKGARRSAPRVGGRAQSLWYWRTARVFLSETTFRLHPRPKSRSRKRRSKK